MFKNIIFDIDGTLVESRELLFQSLNYALEKFQYPQLTDADVKLFFKIGPKAFIKKTGLPSYKIALLYLHSLKYKFNHLDLIKPIPGITKLISDLKNQNVFLGVISSNNKKTIKKILELNGLDVFEFYESAGLFNKAIYLKRIIRRFNLVKQDTLYVGDEIRDIEAAHLAGIKVAAVTWGLGSVSALQKLHPDILLKSPQDLLKTSI